MFPMTEHEFSRNADAALVFKLAAFFSDAGKLGTKAFLSRSCCLGPLVRRYKTGRWEVPQIDQRNRTLNELHDTRNYETACSRWRRLWTPLRENACWTSPF